MADETLEPPSSSSEAEAEPRPPERFDDDGLPLDRPATLDDVRSQEYTHRKIAVGCFFLVVCLVLAFWVLRGGLLG